MSARKQFTPEFEREAGQLVESGVGPHQRAKLNGHSESKLDIRGQCFLYAYLQGVVHIHPTNDKEDIMGRSVAILRYFMWAGVLCVALSACSVTETVKEILSSTTPGDSFTADGLLKADKKVNVFVAVNFENLKQDMAQGHGEYLTSLSALLGVPQNRQEAFFAYAQSRYPFVNTSGSGPSDLVALLAQDRFSHNIY
jgi:hypothetical protein